MLKDAMPSNTIGAKTLYILIGMLIVFLLSLHVVAKYVLLDVFKKIENIDNVKQAAHLQTLYKYSISSLDGSIKDWGVWDDTYDYVKTASKKYEEANLNDTTLKNLSIEGLFVFNDKLNLVGHISYGNMQELLKIVPKNMLEVALAEKGTTKRVVIFQDRPMLVVTGCVVPSTKIADANGVIVFVKPLDDKFFGELSELFGDDLYYTDIKYADLSQAITSDINEESVTAIYSKDDLDKAYISLLPDGAKSLFTISFLKKYEFYDYGSSVLGAFAVIATIFVMSFFLVIYLLLKIFILNRLSKLSEELKLTAVDKNARLKVSGSDEFCKIAAVTNELLDSVSEYQRTIEEHNQTLKQEVAKQLTQLRKQDAAMLRQSRFATVGETIANIAHQWRQPLNNLWLLAQQLKDRYKKDKLTPELLDESMQNIKELIMYMSQTIDDFRNFFSPNKDKIVFSVNEQVAKSLEMLAPSLEAACIAVKSDICHNVCVLGLPGEFAQVVMILLNNAKDALKSNKIENATIYISLRYESNDIILSVQDNAGGIERAVLDTLFDAYVTTKQDSGGTGLGLYMAKIITTGMGGTIEACNENGGAKFTVCLPSVECNG